MIACDVIIYIFHVLVSLKYIYTELNIIASFFFHKLRVLFEIINNGEKNSIYNATKEAKK